MRDSNALANIPENPLSACVVDAESDALMTALAGVIVRFLTERR
jgi:hypothetical protein